MCDYKIPVALKTGSDIKAFFTQYSDSNNGVAYTAFTKADSAPTDADLSGIISAFGETKYLDADDKSVPFWVKDTTIYYYLEDSFSLLLAQDSSGMFS